MLLNSRCEGAFEQWHLYARVEMLRSRRVQMYWAPSQVLICFLW